MGTGTGYYQANFNTQDSAPLGNSYRNYLQGIANSGGVTGQEASALLQKVGDDGRLDQRFTGDQRVAVPYYQDPNTQYGYGVSGLTDLNRQYYDSYSQRGGNVLGARTGDGGSTGGTGGTAASRPSYDPQAVAIYDQGINQANSAIGRLGTQEQVGNENINNSFNDNLNKLLGVKSVAQRDYDTNKTQSTQDNMKAKSSIDYSVGRQANGLQRLLGSRGSGNSSAARVAAPYAAALQGTQQRSQVQDAFGRNMQSLDTNWQDFSRGWDTSREDLDRQKFQNQNSLKSDVATKRASLLSTLANLNSQRSAAIGGDASASVAAAQPFLNQVNDAYGQIDQLGRQYQGQINVQSPNYAAPELQQYNYDRPNGPQLGNASAMTDTVLPYLSVLMRNRKQQNAL